jgi:hypothetical protein
VEGWLKGLIAAACFAVFTLGPTMAGEYSTRDLANELLASRVCGLQFDQVLFTKAIAAIMTDTGHPRETVTAQARQLADDIEERLGTAHGITKAALCAELRAQRPVFE